MLKLTQRAAAALVHVSPNTWARWERGEAKPRGVLQRQLIAKLPNLARPSRLRHDSSRLHRPELPAPDKMPRSTGATLLRFVGTWVGDDAERCLELVHATRGLAEF